MKLPSMVIAWCLAFVAGASGTTAAVEPADSLHNFGVPWIQGTFLDLSDLPPLK